MGVSTKGLIKGNVYGAQILDFVKKEFDVTATMHQVNGDINNQGYIQFSVNENEVLNMYFCEGLDDYTDVDDEMTSGNYTYFSMRYSAGTTFGVARKIVAQFGGGAVEEADSFDSDGFVPVALNSNGDILPVIKMTKAEINKHFGGVVIIID